MAKVIHFPSSKRAKLTGLELEKLILNPLRLFGSLYQSTVKDFERVSHPFLSDPDKRKQLDILSVRFFRRFCRIHPPGTPLSEEARKEILAEMDGLGDKELANFSLFIGLSKFIENTKIGEIKALGVIEVDGLRITPKPNNPIVKSLGKKDTIRKTEDVGVKINEFTDIFNKISILEEFNPKLLLKKPNRILVETNDYLRKQISKGCKIAVSPFFTELEFDTDSRLADWPEGQRTPYLFKKVINFGSAQKALFALLEQCIKEEINILVLPELTIDESLLGSLKGWLRDNNREKVSSGKGGLLLVVAGSFHVPESEDFRNAAPVLNHRGEVIWTQDKFRIYSCTSDDIQKAPEIQRLLKISKAGGYEMIEPSEGFIAVDTPLGRIGVSICLDFIAPENTEVFRRSGINVFFVPAMSESNVQFVDISKQFGRTHLAASFVALASFLPNKLDDIVPKTASFLYIPSRSKPYEYAINENRILLKFYFKSDD